MKSLEHIDPLLRPLSQGVFQCSLRFDRDALSVDAFQAAGYALPSALSTAVKKRQIEFLIGRYCARFCLQHLGLQAADVGYAADRSPIWPLGFRGSISHSGPYATAVVGEADRFEGIGIDLEQRIEKLSPQLIAQICSDKTELSDLMQGSGWSDAMALTLIFSAKESLYKAVHPRLQAFFGFQAARVAMDAKGSLHIELLSTLSDRFMRGQAWDLQYRLLDEMTVETLLLDL